MKYAPPIQLSSLKALRFKRRPTSVNYLEGFWIDLVRDIVKRIPFKGRFSFKLRWEHVIIAFLLGMLVMSGTGSTHIIRHQIPGLSPAPAIISIKPLPKLKDVSYAPQDTLQTVWVNKLRPPGTYFNGYAPGNCTAGVAGRLPIPDNWGNATNWAYAASLAGYTITNTPQAGTIAQTSGDSYLGHVAVVESVNTDGSFVIWEENYFGLGVTDERTTTTAEFPNFIIP